MAEFRRRPNQVGPVIEASALGRVIVAALQEHNPSAIVSEEGSYLRVSAGDRCLLPRVAVESKTGREFRLPGDLESVMPAFKGRFRFDNDSAEWIAFENRSAP